MGSTVSVCNLTHVILHVCLKQSACLHTEQVLLLPKQCVARGAGRVWFTLEAKLWHEINNNYDEDMTREWTRNLEKQHNNQNITYFENENTILKVKNNELSHVIRLRSWLTSIVQMSGVYIGRRRKVAISGGPKANITMKNRQLYQIIDATVPYVAFNHLFL